MLLNKYNLLIVRNQGFTQRKIDILKLIKHKEVKIYILSSNILRVSKDAIGI